MFKLKFKKIYNKIFIISLSLSFNLCYAKNYEFKSVQIFGDSLSDMGFNNKVAIADKNNNALYPQYLSNIFTGKNIKNFHLYDLSGTNHSGIGLTAVTDVYYQYTNNHNALQFTINDFINYQSSSKDNSKNLYIIWAGSNDLTQNTVSYVFNDPTPLFRSVSNSITYQMQRLYNANAKYIMVANIFSPAIGPLSVKNQLLIPIIIDSVYNTIFLQNIVLPILILSEIFIDDFTNIDNFIDNKTRFKALLEARLVAKQDKILRDKDNTFIGQGNDIDLVFYQINANSHIRIIDNLLKMILKKVDKVVQGFNKELEASLKSLEKDVVYIDINGLYKDIRDNSKFYGIDDIVMPQCSLGMISYEVNDICIKGNKYNHDEKIYMFSDQIHPSGFMHKIFAQYMESIFNSPVRVSSITRQMVSLNTNAQDKVFNQLINHNPDDGITSFVSLSSNINNIGEQFDYNSKKSYMSILNIGLKSNIDDKFTIGSMLSTSLGHYTPYDNFKYNFNSEILNLFGQLNTKDNWILSTNFSLGRIGINNIKRTILLGLGQHIKSSNTKGNIMGINLNVAKKFTINHNLNISPVLKLYLNKYHVNAFQEKDNQSTAMRYNNINYTFKELSLGLRSSYTNDDMQTYSQIDIHQPINQLPIQIKSGLKSTSISFTREIASFNKRYLNILAGFTKNISTNLNLNSQINFKFDNYHNKNLDYSIGLNYKF